MIYDEYFGTADAAWVPTLLDIEINKAEEPDGGITDWCRYGWSALEVPDDCPNVRERFGTLQMRFNARYANRMLGAETMERWQVRLQNRFDEVVHRYDRMYSLYNMNRELMDDITPGLKTTYKRSDDLSGSDSSTGTSRSSATAKDRTSNTPDSRINSLDDYAGLIGVNESSSSGDTTTMGETTRTGKTEATTAMVRTGAEIIQQLHLSADSYRDIDTEFIGEFENIFLNIFWY